MLSTATLEELKTYAASEEAALSLDACLTLAKRLNDSRDSGALEYASLALQKAIASSHHEATALAYLELAQYFLGNTMDYPASLQHCEKALKQPNISSPTRARAHRLKGINHFYLSHINEAAKEYVKALDILRSLKNPDFATKDAIANLYYNLAILNNTPDNNFLRAHYLNLAIEIFTSIGSNKGIALCNDGMAVYYFNEQQYDKAIYHHQRALDIFENLKDLSGQARSHNNLGAVYLRQGEYERGFQYLQQALHIHRLQDEKWNLSIALINLANTCLEWDRLEQALPYLNEAHDILQQTENNQLLCDLYDTYRKVYEARGQFEKAYKYQSLWIVCNKAIHTQEKNNSISNALAKCTTDQKEQRAIYEKEKEQQIRNYIQRLKSVNNELEQFVHAAAHDLRSPLRTIRSFAELLQRKLKTHDAAEVHEYTDFIISGIERMNDVIHDLLDYATVASLYEEKKEIDLKKVVDQIREEIRPFLQEKNGGIYLRKSAKLMAPPSQIHRLFTCLIENGLKFNNDSAPCVTITYAQDAHFHKISFRDNGIGFEPKYCEKIFTIFQQLHKFGEYSGTGMGLTIGKKIVDKLNGRIEVETAPGKGSTFIVWLPMY